MKNQYYNEMVQLLMDHPKGMRVGVMARIIYNSNCDLFDTDAKGRFRKIYESVKRYLWTQSRQKHSPFERLKWGTYGLRKNFVFQLELAFDDWDEESIDLKKMQNEPRASKNPEAYMLDMFA